eukprot:CAMPEP_0202354120 /NCGR_PEP_ID=MMETSP1126-20121109/9582_1 /ASSEMBLY_ACC=CAM_ASM_000457 /TAXON_ID=3047 /ORGANISM="Dunaliella tertiolecta, Strain CCMP1320" /LENGTH=297 /DNA_ID=CAMNT_0048946553 /DNA_START=164 /DNA_END=1057 /DNA_ORIENTATION=-
MMMTKYLLMAPITVSAIHLLTTAACVALLEALGVFGSEEKGQSMPKKHLAVFVLISCISLASASYSLAWNTLGLYQMFKLGILPVTFAMELMLALRRYHFVLVTALAAVMVGLFITLYRDSALRLPGLLMATLFVASTGIQQVLCGRLQQMYSQKPHQLLLKTASILGSLLLLSGPFLDKGLTGAWISSWEVNVPGLEMLLASCGAAVVVNLTQYMILGQFSASSYQVFGTFFKSVIVLVGVAVLFNDRWVDSTGYLGCATGLAGLLLYGAFALKQTSHQANQATTVKIAFGPGTEA